MKIFVSVLMLSFFSLSWGQKQKLPAWENNIYWYNQYNTGRTFFNVWTDIFPLPNGEVFLKPYYGDAAKIGANYYTNVKKHLTEIGEYTNTFSIKNQVFIIFKNQIYRINSIDSYKEKQYQLITTLPQYHYDNTLVQNHRAYIAGRNDETQTSALYLFDGEQIRELKKFKGAFMKIGIYHGVQYWFLKDRKNKKTTFYTLKDSEVKAVKQVPFVISELHFNSLEDFYFVGEETPYREAIFHYKNGKISTAFPLLHAYTSSAFQSFFTHKNGQLTQFYDLNKNEKPFAQTTAVEKVHKKTYSPETESIYFGTMNDLARMFLLLKKYPRLFNESNSDAIFSIGQTADGKVWTGSYNGYITTLNGEKQTQSKVQEVLALPGGISVGNKHIINDQYTASLLLFENENRYKKIAENVAGFYNFVSSKNIFYAGVNNYRGLMYKPVKEIENTQIPWKFAGKEKGIHLINCLTIAEDRFGNIWTGHTSSGIAVYQPDKDQGKTWRIDKNEIPFGSGAMLTDSYQTLWIATTKGQLYYWNGKHKEDFDTKNFISLHHPLLDLDHENISFIHQWKDYLILGKHNKILLLDLKAWYSAKEVKIRYLNPVEAAFSGMLGQNTIFTDFRDETLWFSTTDMLYNWDIKRWTKLPTYKVKPVLNIKTEKVDFTLQSKEKTRLAPDQNSFELSVFYQAKDNMPRFISMILTHESETSTTHQKLGTDRKFDFKNLASGNYTAKVLVCQQDGSYEEFSYPIEISKHWWEYWTFWATLSLLIISIIYLYFRKHREVERQKATITQLNLITLSKQFRPHFMLNALNSLGSEMIGMPHAERIISRIGESINIMYSFIKKNKIYLPFEMEWKLTLNTIDIQKEIFIKELEFTHQGLEIIPKNYNIPIGLVQIMVENALLHGIRHRKSPPYLLKISISQDDKFYYIEIEDNGVGKENSAKFINSKKNGTGIQKTYETIAIINSKIPNALAIEFEEINPMDKENPGTRVRIKMKKNIHYENHDL